MDSLLESLRDMLPLLIFVVVPLLGRLGSWLTKRAKGQEQQATDGKARGDLGAVLHQDAAPQDEGGLQAFLKPVALEPSPVPAAAINPRKRSHRPKGESLKEHLANRGRLSMDDLAPQTWPKQKTKQTRRRGALVPAKVEQGAYGLEEARPSSQDVLLGLRDLRQAMIWHEILSKPISLREAEDLL